MLSVVSVCLSMVGDVIHGTFSVEDFLTSLVHPSLSSLDLFRYVYYVTHISIDKRPIGLQLKCLLVNEFFYPALGHSIATRGVRIKAMEMKQKLLSN